MTQHGKPNPAEVFEQFLGPAIFQPWSRELLAFAAPEPGERVLDLACATGIVARHVAPIVGNGGSVVAVDISPEMLAVARDLAPSSGPPIDWRQGDAMALDLNDRSFDLVLCQQGMQFFPDPVAAAREIGRVLDSDGRAAITVWQPLERHPVYRALLEAEARHLGADLHEVATPFMFGDDKRLRQTLDESDFTRVTIVERTIDVEFGDADQFVALTIFAGAAVIPEFAQEDPTKREELIGSIRRQCADVLARYRSGDRIQFPMPAYMAMARS